MINAASTLFLAIILLTFFTLVKEIGFARIYLLDFALVPTAFVLMIGKLVSPEEFRIKRTKIDYLVAAMLFFAFVAVSVSYDRAQSFVELADWFRITFVYWAGRILFSDDRQQHVLNIGLIFFAALLIGIGLIQLVSGTSFGLIGNYFGGNLDQMISANVEGLDSKSRISGTTTNPIIFAMWITLFSSVLLAKLLEDRRYFWFFSLTAASFVVVISTLSRGAIGAYVISWFLVIILQRKQIIDARMFATVAVLILFSPVIILAVVNQLALDETVKVLQARVQQQELLEKDSMRGQLISTGISLLQKPKIFVAGIGPGNFSRVASSSDNEFRSIKTSGAKYSRSGIHNVWLKSWVEYGIGMFISMACFFLAAGAIGYSVLRQNVTGSDRAWAGGILAFLVPYVGIDSQVYESAMSYHLLIPLFFIIGVVVSRSTLDGGSVPEAPNSIQLNGLLR